MSQSRAKNNLDTFHHWVSLIFVKLQSWYIEVTHQMTFLLLWEITNNFLPESFFKSFVKICKFWFSHQSHQVGTRNMWPRGEKSGDKKSPSQVNTPGSSCLVTAHLAHLGVQLQETDLRYRCSLALLALINTRLLVIDTECRLWPQYLLLAGRDIIFGSDRSPGNVNVCACPAKTCLKQSMFWLMSSSGLQWGLKHTSTKFHNEF